MKTIGLMRFFNTPKYFRLHAIFLSLLPIRMMGALRIPFPPLPFLLAVFIYPARQKKGLRAGASFSRPGPVVIASGEPCHGSDGQAGWTPAKNAITITTYFPGRSILANTWRGEIYPKKETAESRRTRRWYSNEVTTSYILNVCMSDGGFWNFSVPSRRNACDPACVFHGVKTQPDAAPFLLAVRTPPKPWMVFYEEHWSARPAHW